MPEMPSVTPSMLRVDTSRAAEYLYADKPKLTFWQKLGRGVGKVLGFLGPIGAAVTAIAVPGVGIPIAAGIYGLSKVAQDATTNAVSKDAAKMNEYNQKMANTQVGFPGLFEGQSQPEITTDFIAPSEYSSSISNTLISRETARNGSLGGF